MSISLYAPAISTTLLAPVSPVAHVNGRYVEGRQGRWIRNPGARSMSMLCNGCKLTLAGRVFRRPCALFSGDTKQPPHSLLSTKHNKQQVALRSFVGTGTGRGEGEEHGKVGLVEIRKRGCLRVRAYMDFPYRIPYPEVAKRPDWWWRTLACVPYLMALQLSDTAFYFQPLMEHYQQFELLSYYVPGAIRRLPSWFLVVYCFLMYMIVVRKEKWPHFFRYHVMMGLLLENALQILWHTSNFMPLINYWGKFGMHYWAMVGLVYITLLLECVRCAISGMYVTVPFVSDAALLQTPYSKGGP